MSNITVTNIDRNSPILEGGRYRDDVLVAAEATTFKEGTILTRAAGKLAPYAAGGTGPVVVLTYDVVASAAGDIPVRVAVSGDFRAEKLVLHADGDASNITVVELDHLRNFGFVAVDVQELNIPDNQ